MRFKQRSHLAGMHATLSPSNNSWTNYDLDKMEAIYRALQAAKKGTELHALAAELIRLGQPLEDTGQTLNSYVNDGIGYRMEPEQVLFVSENAFGTADTIADRDNYLRIHDLKTGLTESSVRQLEVYAAFYCIEYNENPFKFTAQAEGSSTGIELRIYQNDEVKVFEGDPDVITHLMEHTRTMDKLISQMKVEG